MATKKPIAYGGGGGKLYGAFSKPAFERLTWNFHDEVNDEACNLLNGQRCEVGNHIQTSGGSLFVLPVTPI